MTDTIAPPVVYPEAVVCGPSSPHWRRGVVVRPDGTREVHAQSGQTPHSDPATTTEHPPDPELIRSVQNN